MSDDILPFSSMALAEIRKKRPTVVCICGSTRFMDLITKVAAELTLQGEIVIRPECIAGEVTPEQKKALDILHFRKIDIADYVFVVNPEGYIGESTSNEIKYAWDNHKFVFYYQPRGVYQHKVDKNAPLGAKIPPLYQDPDLLKRD